MATALAGCVAAAATIPFVSRKQVATENGGTIHDLQAKAATAAGVVAAVKDPDARLLRLCREWWAQKRKTDALFAAIDEKSDDVRKQEEVASESDNLSEALLARMAKQRARTVEGFASKMHVLRNCGANSIDHNSTYNDDRLIVSVVEDSERLFTVDDECHVSPAVSEDPVVTTVREIDRLQSRFNDLDEMRGGEEGYRQREMRHLEDDIRAHRAYLMTLRPQSIEGALLLVGAAFDVESVAWSSRGEDLRARSHRELARALWAVADFLVNEFDIDADALGLSRLMDKHMNPWQTYEERLAECAKRDSSRAA